MQLESGHSPQIFLFWQSGQHGMSPDMPVICRPAPDARFPAAAGNTTGAMANPTVTSTASRNLRNRVAFITTNIPQPEAGWKPRNVHFRKIAEGYGGLKIKLTAPFGMVYDGFKS
jgi:hypothetical protein